MYFVKMELISSQLDDVVFLTAKICLLVFHLDAFSVYAAFRFRGTVYNVENELKVLSREPPKPLRPVELR